ncbi:hypothetical protein V6N13_011568 [Hibiscus sabdariffa]
MWSFPKNNVDLFQVSLVRYGSIGGWQRRRDRKLEGSTTRIRDGEARFGASSGFRDFEAIWWKAASTDSEMVVLLVRTDIGFFSGSHKEEGGVIFRRLHCREGFCFDNGVDQFLVAKRIISYGRNEGELSVEELFLFWRSERFRKYKIRSSRSFLSSLLVAQRCLPRSDFTSIASFLSLFWKKVQVLISGRQGYEVL